MFKTSSRTLLACFIVYGAVGVAPAHAAPRAGTETLSALAAGSSVSVEGSPAAKAVASPGPTSAPPKVSLYGPSQAELDALRAAVKAAPDNPDAHFNLAMALARTCFLEQGWEELKRIQELDPAYADKVVERLAPLVETNPSDVASRFRLGFAYYFQNKKELARSQFEQLVALAPQDPWSYNYLGYLSAEQNQLEPALQLWQKALVLEPDNAVAQYLVGQVHYRQGRFLQAAQALGNAVRLRAASPLHI